MRYPDFPVSSDILIIKRGHIMKNPEITITMEDGGVIRAELYPAVAPNTEFHQSGKERLL